MLLYRHGLSCNQSHSGEFRISKANQNVQKKTCGSCYCLKFNLFNIWINEHDVGHLAGAVPLLVMDVFEHAFVLDYGLDKASYIKSFMGAVDWDIVSKRFD